MPGWLDTAPIAAAVSFLMTARGWFAAHRITRRLDFPRGRERLVDTQAAPIAEIRGNLSRFASVDLEGLRDAVLRLIAQAPKRAPYTPFVPRYAHAIVFETVLGDIHVSPAEVVRDFVSCYKLEYKLSPFVRDPRDPKFAALSGERKQAVYADRVRMIEDTLAAGRTALHVLEVSLQKL